jgi:hypothetical protein
MKEILIIYMYTSFFNYVCFLLNFKCLPITQTQLLLSNLCISKKESKVNLAINLIDKILFGNNFDSEILRFC